MSQGHGTNQDELTGRAPRVLVIEDDHYLLRALGLALAQADIDVRLAANGAEGLTVFSAWPADVVVCDIYMPEMDGLETIPELLERMPGCKILAISGAVDPLPDQLSTAEMLGAVRTLQKTSSTDALVDVVRSMLVDEC